MRIPRAECRLWMRRPREAICRRELLDASASPPQRDRENLTGAGCRPGPTGRSPPSSSLVDLRWPGPTGSGPGSLRIKRNRPPWRVGISAGHWRLTGAAEPDVVVPVVRRVVVAVRRSQVDRVVVPRPAAQDVSPPPHRGLERPSLPWKDRRPSASSRRPAAPAPPPDGRHARTGLR